MATCPACSHDVRAPFFMNLQAWSELKCPQCQSRLEMKPPRALVPGTIIAPLFVLARRGRAFEIFAFVFMFATLTCLLVEALHPQVRLRKRPLPKPSIRLNIDGPPN